MAKTTTGWKLDKMPEKLTAMATFHGELLGKLSNDPVIASKIRNAGAQIVSKYFEAYVDHAARIDSYRYHHIYEFNSAGNKNSRLFRSTVKDGKISYSLIDSSKPNQNGQVFVKKAFIMEAGEPILIKPTNSKTLAYEIDGEMVFSKSSRIQESGGPFVAGAFQSIFDEFFNSKMGNKALEEFGFYDTIIKGISSETNKIIPRISAGAINKSAQMAVQAAYGILGKVEGNVSRL